MKKIRIGKDVDIRWTILTNGEPDPLHGRDLKVVILDPIRRRTTISDYSADGNILSFRYPGTQQKSVGKHSLTLWENYGKIDMTAVDACNVFELVATTCQEPASDIESETVQAQSNIQIGIKGASAYEVAVENGFQGTVEEWLQSLKQPALDAAAEAESRVSAVIKTAETEIESLRELNSTVSNNEGNRQEAEFLRVVAETKREENESERQTAEQDREEAEVERVAQENSRIKAENQRISTEERRVSQEHDREHQELERKTNESTREANEISRREAEIDRKNAEEARTDSETGRAQAEAKRVSNETLRKEQENQRTTGEQERNLAEQNRRSNEVLRQDTETQRERNEAVRIAGEESRVEAEAERKTAEESRNSLEIERTESEQSRNSAEQARSSAEQSRSSAEAAREQSEEARVSSETVRRQAETTREQQEQSRQSAEQRRVTTFAELETQATQIVSQSETAINNANQAIENVNQAAEAVDGRITDIEIQIDDMEKNGNALTSDIAAGKELVAQAITNKGVLTSGTDSFEKMAENIGQIYKGAYDDSFKVKINDNLPSPEVERVGSSVFPNWLEANIRNVMLKDGVINYYLDRTNSRLRNNGLPANTDGSDGDVMIILPQFWYSMVFTAEGIEITYSNVGQTSEGWKESPEIYVGASEGVIQTTGGKDYLRSCYNTAPEFRGGSHGSTNSSWDNLPKSLLGMARTNKNHDAFRIACLNKANTGTGVYHQFDYRTYFKLLLMFMAVYGTRNIQDEYSGIDLTTGEDKRNSDGFKYGGLGRGVADCGAWWYSFNASNPFIKTDVSFDLGCRSGVIDYPVNIGTEESPVVQMVKVPVLWGIANPYGHIFKCMDGITKQAVEIDGKKYDRWALFYNPKFYKSSGQTDADKVIDIPTVNSGYIKKMDGNFLPTMVGGSESSYWTDYIWASSSLQSFAVFNGGSASHGGSCGLACEYSPSGVGHAYSDLGGRLCFSPS